jgi:hypothetical protein
MWQVLPWLMAQGLHDINHTDASIARDSGNITPEHREHLTAATCPNLANATEIFARSQP